MRQTRMRYTEEFKLKVIIEALRKKSNIKDVAKVYHLHPDLVGRWRREFLNTIAYDEFFHDKTENELEEAFAKREAKLCRKIRKLNRQLVWLKRKMKEALPQEERLALLERQNGELSLYTQARLLAVEINGMLYRPSRVKDGSYRLLKSITFRPVSLL